MTREWGLEIALDPGLRWWTSLRGRFEPWPMLAWRRSEDRVPKQPAAPKVLNQAKARALLEKAGWSRTLGGKHVVKMVKEGHPPITLPMHKGRDYGPRLRAAILKQAGLNL